ncbi:MAG: P-loop NTPase, partial [Actinomycetota bacterium]|nr:P-loop NTPase [Actinomycetota bacterium]
MRVLVTGKGGVGKTTVASALCAALADAGVDVVAIDADSSPNLALSLGGGHPDGLPAVANLTPPRAADGCDSDPLAAPEIIERYAVATRVGVPLVQTGRIERPSQRCLCCGSHATARQVIAALPGDERQLVVSDLEPGLNDLLWAKPGPGDVVVAVTDPSQKALEVTRRTLSIARELGVTRALVVANKLREDEPEVVRAALPDTQLVEVAYQPALDRSTPDGQRPG